MVCLVTRMQILTSNLQSFLRCMDEGRDLEYQYAGHTMHLINESEMYAADERINSMNGSQKTG